MRPLPLATFACDHTYVTGDDGFDASNDKEVLRRQRQNEFFTPSEVLYGNFLKLRCYEK